MTSQQTDINWRESKAWQNWWKKFSPIEKFGIRLAVVAVFIGIVGYLNQHAGFAAGFTILSNLFADFYANVSSELISVVITILVLDRLNRHSQNKQELTRLKALLKSNENVVTKIAIAELGARGWWSDGSLRKIDLQNAILLKAELSYSNMQEAILAKANLEAIKLSFAKMQEAQLWQANLQKAMLVGTYLNNAKLESANCTEAEMSSAKLQGAFLKSTILENTNLDSANLSGAFLENANLKGANLRNATFRNASVYGVICDENTILPDGKRWFSDINWVKYGASTEKLDIQEWYEWQDYLNENGISFDDVEQY